ncbi:MAG: TIGR00341 family protein [Gammaproteobacteria bacterium]|nr:MAG: TIGR00341 family protein [Gammaproteobacteria bacterium]
MGFFDAIRSPKNSSNSSSGLPSEDRRAVLEDLFVFGKDNQRPFLHRMAFLLVVSTVIACSGLLADSVAVVIGAMLVAPMMRPVMSAAAAITLGWSNRLFQSLLLTMLMAVTAVLISAVFAWISPDMVVVPGQVLARTEPTYFDLVIALAAGSGGAFTMTRKETSAIPGVAMAVALLPPLASTGILLVMMESELALKAFVLFFTNFAAMVFAGSITFLFVGVSPKKARGKSARFTRNYLLGFAILVVGISVPLYFYSNEVWYDGAYQANQSTELQAWLTENDLSVENVHIDEERQLLLLQLSGPNPPLNVETLHAEIGKRRKLVHGITEPFEIEVQWTQTARFSWPPEKDPQAVETPLEDDFSRKLKFNRWHWIGTQYADGNWLRPKHKNTYFIKVVDDHSVRLWNHCTHGTGSYELSQGELHVVFDIKVSETCDTYQLDQRYITDLNQVANLHIEDDHLSLRLNNDDGVMHFELTNEDND